MIEGLTILRQYATTKYFRRFADREELERWQEDRVIAFLKRVLPESPFYARQFSGRVIQEWRSAPTTDKKTMMDNFDLLNTVRITKKEAFAVALQAEQGRDFRPTIRGLTVGLSSGTSGNRGLFVASENERARWAGAVLAKVLPAPLWVRQRIAFFMRANSNLYTTVNRGTIRLHFFDMWQPLDGHIGELNHLDPTMVVAPPSILIRLAKEQKKGALRITPQKIVSIAENLEPLDERMIRTIFGQTIHQIYQCTEGFLAATCPFGTLHLNEDLVVVQKDYLDRESGRFFPIITDFSRYTQPIIRYRLDDILIEKKAPCACGSCYTALESIEGRADDIFYGLGSDGNFITLYPDFIRQAVMAAHEEIREYFVVQTHPTQLVISLQIDSSLRQKVETRLARSLIEVFDHFGAARPDIQYGELTVPARAKLRRIERRFSPWK